MEGLERVGRLATQFRREVAERKERLALRKVETIARREWAPGDWEAHNRNSVPESVADRLYTMS
jgi:hypothetical protein